MGPVSAVRAPGVVRLLVRGGAPAVEATPGSQPGAGARGPARHLRRGAAAVHPAVTELVPAG
ncbi:MAG TPA: hypothetical protein VM142_03615 [Acidimicrobiales bacterium]|nr:hypothetical protein [Acidimicrobiales bacterium]